MLTKKGRGGFDAAVWKGPMDLKAVTVRLSMLLGLAALWLGLVIWIFFTG